MPRKLTHDDVTQSLKDITLLMVGVGVDEKGYLCLTDVSGEHLEEPLTRKDKETGEDKKLVLYQEEFDANDIVVQPYTLPSIESIGTNTLYTLLNIGFRSRLLDFMGDMVDFTLEDYSKKSDPKPKKGKKKSTKKAKAKAKAKTKNTDIQYPPAASGLAAEIIDYCSKDTRRQLDKLFKAPNFVDVINIFYAKQLMQSRVRSLVWEEGESADLDALGINISTKTWKVFCTIFTAIFGDDPEPYISDAGDVKQAKIATVLSVYRKLYIRWNTFTSKVNTQHTYLVRGLDVLTEHIELIPEYTEIARWMATPTIDPAAIKESNSPVATVGTAPMVTTSAAQASGFVFTAPADNVVDERDSRHAPSGGYIPTAPSSEDNRSRRGGRDRYYTDRRGYDRGYDRGRGRGYSSYNRREPSRLYR